MTARNRFPIVTVTVLAITGLCTALQAADSRVLPLLERTPDALARHEWWRLVTPLLVHSDGWRQILFNFASIFIVGSVVERVFGAGLWLLIYFSCGLVGEIAGYAWQPLGAGASVAGAGLLGALAAWFLFVNRRPPTVFGATILLGGAVVLTIVRDLHGPPLLVGAVMGSVALYYRPALMAGNVMQVSQLKSKETET